VVVRTTVWLVVQLLARLVEAWVLQKWVLLMPLVASALALAIWAAMRMQMSAQLLLPHWLQALTQALMLRMLPLATLVLALIPKLPLLSPLIGRPADKSRR
jgi:hypothetical protein